MRKTLISLAAVATLLSSASALAHDEMSLAGQITSVTAKSVQIKMKDGKIVTLEVDGNTRVVMAGKRLALKDLKVGQSVSAVGFGDNVNDLVAIDVTITAPAKGG